MYGLYVRLYHRLPYILHHTYRIFHLWRPCQTSIQRTLRRPPPAARRRTPRKPLQAVAYVMSGMYGSLREIGSLGATGSNHPPPGPTAKTENQLGFQAGCTPGETQAPPDTETSVAYSLWMDCTVSICFRSFLFTAKHSDRLCRVKKRHPPKTDANLCHFRLYDTEKRMITAPQGFAEPVSVSAFP